MVNGGELVCVHLLFWRIAAGVSLMRQAARYAEEVLEALVSV